MSEDKKKNIYDAVCKSLLSEKQILAHILKNCVQEYRDIDIKEIASSYIEGTARVGSEVVRDESLSAIVVGMNTEDNSPSEGAIRYDILFDARIPGTDDKMSLIINVEAQNRIKPGYPLIKRAIYYCSRMISSQVKKATEETRYKGLRKVYSIWICLDPDEKRRGTITRYAIGKETLYGHPFEEDVIDYDLLQCIMVCLGHGSEQTFLRFLEVLLGDMDADEKMSILEREYAVECSESIQRKVDEMCNLSEGIWQKGEEAGLQKGRQEGLQEGLQKGEEKMLLKNIRILMKNMKCTAEQAMFFLGVPEDERPQYAARLDV